MNGFAVFKLLGRRLLSRTELRIAVTAVLVLTTIAFIERCMQSYGFDVGALPSAATGWAWNMDRMGVQSMRVLAFFLIFLIAASVFADNLYLDSKRGVTSFLVSRCSLTSYVVSNALLAFIGGFLIILLPLALSQLLAFCLFPFEGTYAGILNNPVYAFSESKSILFPELFYNHPYLNNLVFAFYASFWAGTAALLSFALSLFIKKSRLVILGIPTALALLSWYIVPALNQSSIKLTHFNYLYPNATGGELSLFFFFVAPFVVLVLSFVMIIWGLRSRKKDILL